MAVLAAFALRWWLRTVFGETGAPLQMFFLAVFVAAWAGGLANGLLATFSSLVLAYAAFFQHPDGLLSLSRPDVIRAVVFLIIGIVFSVLSESRLVALEREAAQREQLIAEQSARAAALTEVAEQREQLQRVADRVPVILASCGLDRRFKFVNQANADRFGLTPADMVGRRLDEFLGPETAAELEPHIERVLAGERVEYEMTYTLPLTGQQRMQCTYVPERAADGSVIGWIAALVNVTPIRQVEADVKNFGSLIQNTSDLVVMSDLALTPIYANDAATRISGVPSAGAGVGSLLDLFAVEDRAAIERDVLPRALRTGVVETETRLQEQRRGTTVWMGCTVVLLRDSYGKPSGYGIIGRDLTERKREEELLREAGRRKDESIAALRHIADSMPQIIWSAGPDGRLDYYNRRWYELLGVAASAVTDGALQAPLHPDDRQATHDRWMASVRSGTPFEMEYRLESVATDGFRWYLARALPVARRGRRGGSLVWHQHRHPRSQDGRSRARRESRPAARCARRLGDRYVPLGSRAPTCSRPIRT